MSALGLAVQEALFRRGTAPVGWALRPLRGLAFGAWMTVFYFRHPMSEERRLPAVLAVWAWQVWRRLVRRPVVVELQTGARLRCPHWSRVAGAWIALGLNEPAEMLFASHLLRPGDRFVDVGANIGVYSMIAARRGARSIAFEPNARALAAVEANARLNGADVIALPFALADTDSRARLTTDLDNMNHLVVGQGAGDEVEVRRLDTVVPPLLGPDDSVALVKVDAEGFDAAVLRGARELLVKHRPAVIAEIWAGGADVRSTLEPLGYEMLSYDPRTRALRAVAAGRETHGSFIAVHPDRRAETEERLRAARVLVRRSPRIRWLAS